MSKPAKDSISSQALEQFVVEERRERLKEILAKRTCSLTVVLDGVRNPHNISAVIRSADAFGISQVHLVGTEFEYCPNISQGSERWIEIAQHNSVVSAIASLKEAGYRLVLLAPQTQFSGIPQLAVSELPFSENLALVFGNEHKGVSPEFAAAADLHAYIPMHGFVESLNISVACAICLFCSTIAEAKSCRRTAALDENSHEYFYTQFLERSIKGSDAIKRELSRRSAAAEELKE